MGDAGYKELTLYNVKLHANKHVKLWKATLGFMHLFLNKYNNMYVYKAIYVNLYHNSTKQQTAC